MTLLIPGSRVRSSRVCRDYRSWGTCIRAWFEWTRVIGGENRSWDFRSISGYRWCFYLIRLRYRVGDSISSWASLTSARCVIVLRWCEYIYYLFKLSSYYLSGTWICTSAFILIAGKFINSVWLLSVVSDDIRMLSLRRLDALLGGGDSKT